MNDEFGDRVALVTAAAGAGVGQAVARRLLAGGARVAVTDSHARRTAEVTTRLAEEFPGDRVVGVPIDVGVTADIDAGLRRVEDALGPVQILVNNAAVNWPGPVWDYPLDRWQRTFDVNVTGAWYLARQTMPAMRDLGGGSIVNISSGAVETGGGFGAEPVYAVTKGAMETLTRALAHDGGPYQIRVNTVSVGVVADSKFMADHPDQLERALRDIPLGRHVLAADVAEAVAFLASDARSGRITGDIVTVNGGALMRT